MGQFDVMEGLKHLHGEPPSMEGKEGVRKHKFAADLAANVRGSFQMYSPNQQQLKD